MEFKSISIRPFIGATNFEISRSFYRDLGFTESILSHNLSYFSKDGYGFYLQDACVPDWIENSMIFMEVDDAYNCWKDIQSLNLTTKYYGVKLTPVSEFDWGRECYMHDPSGILWHFGEFINSGPEDK